MARQQLGTAPSRAADATRQADVVTAGGGITAIVQLTQAAYDALGTKVATTLYVIQG